MTTNFLLQHLTQARSYFIVMIPIFFMVTLDQLLGFNNSDYILSNVPHSFLRDVFLVNYTFMGDTIFGLSLIALLYFHWKNKEVASFMFYSFITTVICIQILKNLFYEGSFTVFIEPGTTLINQASTVHAAVNYSPSMHTAIAFLIATSLVIKFKLSDFFQLSILFSAIGIACSRVYLAHQHVSELLVGAFVGSFSIVLVYFVRAGLMHKLIHVLHKKAQKTNAGQMMPA